jgi:hypothetical protein
MAELPTEALVGVFMVTIAIVAGMYSYQGQISTAVQ